MERTPEWFKSVLDSKASPSRPPPHQLQSGAVFVPPSKESPLDRMCYFAELRPLFEGECDPFLFRITALSRAVLSLTGARSRCCTADATLTSGLKVPCGVAAPLNRLCVSLRHEKHGERFIVAFIKLFQYVHRKSPCLVVCTHFLWCLCLMPIIFNLSACYSGQLSLSGILLIHKYCCVSGRLHAQTYATNTKQTVGIPF